MQHSEKGNAGNSMDIARGVFVFVSISLLAVGLSRSRIRHIHFKREDVIEGKMCLVDHCSFEISSESVLLCLVGCKTKGSCEGLFYNSQKKRCAGMNPQFVFSSTGELKNQAGSMYFMEVYPKEPSFDQKKSDQTTNGEIVIETPMQEQPEFTLHRIGDDIWYGSEGSDSVYMVLTEFTFDEAAIRCRVDLSRSKSQVVLIDEEFERTFVGSLMLRFDISEAYIGYVFDPVTSRMVNYATHEPIAFVDSWKPDNKSEECVKQVIPNNRWQSTRCSLRLNAICEMSTD